MKARILSEKAKHLAKKYNITSNLIINHYFFDSILRRIAKSKYKDNLILKGGYLLSMNFGIISRTTNDIDLLLIDTELSTEIVKDIANEIIGIYIDDSIEFEVKGLEPIKDGDGLKLKIIAKLDNIRQHLSIDIAVDDPVTPSVVLKNYKTIIENENIEINTYPFETILAEKLQTVISLGNSSSRSKDLYDLHILNKFVLDNLSLVDIRNAIENTFQYRKTSIEKEFMLKILKEISNNSTQKKLWERYATNHYFANNLSFSDVMESIFEMINKIG